MEVFFASRDSAGYGLHYHSLLDEFLHLFLRIPPVFGHAHNFVLRIPFCRAARSSHANQPVTPPRPGFDVPVIAKGFLGVWLKRRIEKRFVTLCIEEDRIRVAVEELAALAK